MCSVEHKENLYSSNTSYGSSSHSWRHGFGSVSGVYTLGEIMVKKWDPLCVPIGLVKWENSNLLDFTPTPGCELSKAWWVSMSVLDSACLP